MRARPAIEGGALAREQREKAKKRKYSIGFVNIIKTGSRKRVLKEFNTDIDEERQLQLPAAVAESDDSIWKRI